MKKITTLILILLAFQISYSQIDTSRMDFYPLHVGDVWQYQTEHSQLLTATIRTDTLIAGVKYYVVTGGGLRSQGSGIMRIDSLLHVVQYGFGDTTPIYRLNEKDSAVWSIVQTFWAFPTPNPLVRYDGSKTISLFGENREVLQFDFGGTTSYAPFDTTFGPGALFAKGIGIIREEYYDSPYRYLQGAIIDGVQYGTIVTVQGIEETTPKQFTLFQNFPNPFNPTTMISFQIPATTSTTLKVYDLLGREVATLVCRILAAGRHTLSWNATTVPTGVYLLHLSSGEFAATKKLVVIK